MGDVLNRDDLVAAGFSGALAIAGAPQAFAAQSFSNSGFIADITAAGIASVVLFPIAPSIIPSVTGPLGSIGISPAAVVDLYGTARSAPAQTYYVATTGNDSTGTGAIGAPFATLLKAEQMAKAAGTPTLVYVAGGSYPRSAMPANNSLASDICWVATGTVNCGTWDDFATPTASGTNSWTATAGNVDMIADRLNVDANGTAKPLRYVSSTALVDRIPGTWTYSGGAWYAQREDGAPITNANTRIYRANSQPFDYRFPINVAFLIQGLGQWIVEGGGTSSGGGALSYNPQSKPASPKAVVLDGVTFRNVGGLVSANAGAVSLNNLHGVCFANDCHGALITGDFMSPHNDGGFGCKSLTITTNSSATDIGRVVDPTANNTSVQNGKSCNFFTLHDTGMAGLTIANWCKNGHGGAWRCIGDSITWTIGDQPHDLGDTMNLGAITPTAFRVDGTAKMYVDAPDLSQMPAGSFTFVAYPGSTMLIRNATPNRRLQGGGGVIGTFA